MPLVILLSKALAIGEFNENEVEPTHKPRIIKADTTAQVSLVFFILFFI
jgi:hypothetical protein